MLEPDLQKHAVLAREPFKKHAALTWVLAKYTIGETEVDVVHGNGRVLTTETR